MSAQVAAAPRKRKIDEESKALVAVAKTKAIKTALVRTPTNMFVSEALDCVDTIDFNVDTLFTTDDTPSPERVSALLHRHYNAMKMAARAGKALVRNPDLAMALASFALGLKIHILELNNADVQLQVARTGKKEKYINFSFKGSKQKNFSEHELMGLNFVTSAFVPAYSFEYGSTAETGVNGTFEKIIQTETGSVMTEPGKEKYDCAMGTGPICDAIQDANINNPMALVFMGVMGNVKQLIFKKIWSNAENLVKRRADLAERIQQGQLDRMPGPTEGVEALEALVEAKKYVEKLRTDKNDETSKALGMSASCYRKPRKAIEWLNIEAEDYSGYVPPSPMFAANKITKVVGEDGKPIQVTQLWNELPVWRWRRPNEVEAGKNYRTPWIRIRKENVHLTRNDVIFTLFALKFYEDSARKECAFQHEPVGFVWLNTVDGLKAMNYASLEPCNPLVANPCAGYYKGPLGYEGAAPPPSETMMEDTDDGQSSHMEAEEPKAEEEQEEEEAGEEDAE